VYSRRRSIQYTRFVSVLFAMFCCIGETVSPKPTDGAMQPQPQVTQPGAPQPYPGNILYSQLYSTTGSSKGYSRKLK